jgi:hypothetical protein
MPKVVRFKRAVAPDAFPRPLLVSRKDAAVMLGGISMATMQRMEARGTLRPVRLNRDAKAGQVFYRHADLVALAQGSDDDDR